MYPANLSSVSVFFFFLPVKVTCHLPRRLVHYALSLVRRRNFNIFPCIQTGVILLFLCVRGPMLRARMGNGRYASYCCFTVSKPNKKCNPVFKKLAGIFISLLSRLGKTCDYISLKLIHSFFSGVIHFKEDRQRAPNWGLASQRML